MSQGLGRTFWVMWAAATASFFSLIREVYGAFPI